MSPSDDLERGREAYRRRAWEDAFQAFSRADRVTPLPAEDLELLGTAAYLTDRDPEFLKTFERAHHTHLDADRGPRAARCAFWLGFRLMLRGEMGHATGWLARARRLVTGEGRECVERGYVLLPTAEQQLAAGDHDAAYEAASEALQLAERFGDRDLVACARHLQGRALLGRGRLEQGLALLDEAMLPVTAGDLSPLVTGLIYCSVIEACQEVYALGRAREWTSAMAEWCTEQPELVAFTDTCLVRRAEVFQLHGAWREAIAEAQRACDRFSGRKDRHPPASAFYQLAEVHRLRGEFEAAESAYRSASQWGWEPQPGLALLRLAQGRTEAAAAAMRRVIREAKDPLRRTKLLPACIEVLLAAGDVEEARAACRDLESIAARFDAGVLGAMAAQARGAVALAEGDAQAALVSLRRAWRVWQEVEAPYAAARVRMLVGLACRALGDDDGARLEFDAARAAFDELGATPDRARVDSLARAGAPGSTHGLTARELEVLRLVAAGKTNKVIAKELFLSEKTIDRHVSNIFAKLDVPSRAAATAYAYEHRLI